MAHSSSGLEGPWRRGDEEGCRFPLPDATGMMTIEGRAVSSSVTVVPFTGRAASVIPPTGTAAASTEARLIARLMSRH